MNYFDEKTMEFLGQKESRTVKEHKYAVRHSLYQLRKAFENFDREVWLLLGIGPADDLYHSLVAAQKALQKIVESKSSELEPDDMMALDALFRAVAPKDVMEMIFE